MVIEIAKSQNVDESHHLRPVKSLRRIAKTSCLCGLQASNDYLEHYFVDGTNIEANANRNTFVWGNVVFEVALEEQ
ncbi:hypothetical protein MHH56_23760 [Paenibacillus sp. FSL K6-3182]|uniref:hypothetical protein n=1 Tax=Paenibacillus sp. FSL K6-3182 TaxID=2921495 RepID=UPI0030D2B09C